jgi:hypothetical protein
MGGKDMGGKDMGGKDMGGKDMGGKDMGRQQVPARCYRRSGFGLYPRPLRRISG